MKFLVAFLVVAVAVCANGHHVSAGLVDPWAPTVYSTPWGYPGFARTVVSPYAAWPYAASSVLSHPEVVVARSVAPVQIEGQYVAANRGAVHVAPLPGHAVSQQSLNLQPAEGSF